MGTAWSRIPLLVTSVLLASAQGASWPFGPWHRVSNDPIIAPRGEGWESAGTFNPSVVVHDGQVVMLYRAQDRNGTSRLGYAASADGIHFTRRPEPVLSPEAEYEKDGGVEDPRLVKIDGTYLPDLYRLQQEGCPALPGHIEGSRALGSEGRDPACVPGPVERRMDQVRRHRA